VNDDRNNPKPLPDDFGMTIPNMRLPKQSQQNQGGEADLPTTNLRNVPPPKQNIPPAQPPDDFGMTVPNLRLPSNHQPPAQPSNPYDLPTTNLRQPNQPPPSDADFGLTMNNYNPKQSGASSRGNEDEFASTISYIPYPTKPQPQHQPQYEQTQTHQAPPVLPPVRQQEKRKGGVPIWAWLALGGLFFVGFLGVAGLAAYFYVTWDTSFRLNLKGALPGSTVFIDNLRKGTTKEDGSILISGIEADKRRAVKVTKEGCDDFNTTVEGKRGETQELIVSMKCSDKPGPVKTNNCLTDCKDDPRVCEAECRALDALDKAMTVDELVAAMNLHIINFESNSFVIPPARKRFLERAAEKFKQLKGNPVVEIGGHTDNVGNAAANAKLSENRANAVLTILVNNGVPEKMLKSRGFGSAKPKTTNDTEDGKFQNRRIEYSVLSR
jgi:outer membrane protein OmpA-like peptidoglycan-associated protein